MPNNEGANHVQLRFTNNIWCQCVNLRASQVRENAWFLRQKLRYYFHFLAPILPLRREDLRSKTITQKAFTCITLILVRPISSV